MLWTLHHSCWMSDIHGWSELSHPPSHRGAVGRWARSLGRGDQVVPSASCCLEAGSSSHFPVGGRRWCALGVQPWGPSWAQDSPGCPVQPRFCSPYASNSNPKLRQLSAPSGTLCLLFDACPSCSWSVAAQSLVSGVLGTLCLGCPYLHLSLVFSCFPPLASLPFDTGWLFPLAVLAADFCRLFLRLLLWPCYSSPSLGSLLPLCVCALPQASRGFVPVLPFLSSSPPRPHPLLTLFIPFTEL